MTSAVQVIREATDKDKQYIKMLDLRCFDNVWDAETWNLMIPDQKVKVWVGCNRLVPISFTVLERDLCEYVDDKWSMHIHKLCVSERFRNRGIGTRLIAHAHTRAAQCGVNWITMTVPEWLVNNPKDPRYCLDWIQRFKFKVLGTLDERIPMYGRDNEQYVFGVPIR